MRRILYIFPLLIAAVASAAFSPHGDGVTPRRDVETADDSVSPETMFRLSARYERGDDSIPADSARAMQLLYGAAEKGYLPACSYLGYRLLRLGHNKEGLEWIERAAVAGDAKAQSNLGFLLTEGKIVRRDYEKAAFWLRKGAESGSATAASMLGDLYRDGSGVPRDSAAAEECYMAAVDAGLADAAYKLEDMMSAKWASLPCDSQLALALYFYSGRAPGVAIPILERLAADGDDVSARAAALLGDAYTRALGVRYDHELSLMYYWKSAELGYAPAQFVVGELLEIFPDALDSLTLNPPSADELMRRAADGGINSAKEATEALFSPVGTTAPDSDTSAVSH